MPDSWIIILSFVSLSNYSRIWRSSKDHTIILIFPLLCLQLCTTPIELSYCFFFAQKRLISCKRFKIHFGFHPQCALVSLSRAEKSKRTSEIFWKLVDIFEAAVVPNLRTLKIMNIEIERARMQSLLMCTVVVVQVVVVLGQGGEEWLWQVLWDCCHCGSSFILTTAHCNV